MNRFYSIILFSFTIFSFSRSCLAMNYILKKLDQEARVDSEKFVNKLLGKREPTFVKPSSVFPIEERSEYANQIKQYVETVDPANWRLQKEIFNRFPKPSFKSPDYYEKMEARTFQSGVRGLGKFKRLEYELDNFKDISRSKRSTRKELREIEEKANKISEKSQYNMSAFSLHFTPKDYKKITDARKQAERKVFNKVAKVRYLLSGKKKASGIPTKTKKMRKKKIGKRPKVTLILLGSGASSFSAAPSSPNKDGVKIKRPRGLLLKLSVKNPYYDPNPKSE